MSAIRVVWGTGTGPTATSSYDAALAAANVHNYNLMTVSSVVPADTPIEVVGTAPDLGPAGNRLTVVQGRQTVPPDRGQPPVVGLGWARDRSGRGIFYEASGTDRESVRATVEAGLSRGTELREWSFIEEDCLLRDGADDPGGYTTAVICAVYGQSVPLL